MFFQIRFSGLFLFPVVFTALCPMELSAQQPMHFPWSNQSGLSMPTPESVNSYHVLPSVLQERYHRTQVHSVLYSVAAKPAYAYGWFGSNPSPTWGRHFGSSKNYTQWSRR